MLLRYLTTDNAFRWVRGTHQPDTVKPCQSGPPQTRRWLLAILMIPLPHIFYLTHRHYISERGRRVWRDMLRANSLGKASSHHHNSTYSLLAFNVRLLIGSGGHLALGLGWVIAPGQHS
ncbi:hypothetical protein QBC39DRAFT_33607 [Podospora conica]|nr:hypothetical protein QBC39DRAFT_33607 [Schizothecium conicum]